MKKLLCVLFTFIILTGAASAAYATTDTSAGTAGKAYTDIKTTNWAYESVNAMSEKGILKGYSDGTFKPSNTVTYGEFIKMALIGATNEDVGNSKNGNWAKTYYNKALELKYFGSTDIKAEQLNNIITRSDMALILSNILGETKIVDYDKLEQSVSDVDSTTKHDYDIIKAYATGILTGYADGTFKPEGTLTRAEAVTVIYRLVDESKRLLPETKTKTVKTTTETTKNMVDVLVGTKTYTFESHDVKLGFNGVEKIAVHSSGDILIYSTVKYDSIRLSIDNQYVDAVSFTNGLRHFEKDRYYVYDADPTTYTKNIDVKGKIPSLKFSSDKENIYRYTDVTL